MFTSKTRTSPSSLMCSKSHAIIFEYKVSFLDDKKQFKCFSDLAEQNILVDVSEQKLKRLFT